MKTTCIATVAILGCASAAPRRMRTSGRSLQEGSISMSMPEDGAGGPSLFDTTPPTDSPPTTESPATTESPPTTESPLTTVEAVTIPADIPGGMSMPGPGDVTLDELCMSMIAGDILSGEPPAGGSLSLSVPESSMSVPDGWALPDEGTAGSETSADVPSDDPTDVGSDTVDADGGDADAEDREASSAAGVILSGVASAACVVGAIALF